MKEKKLLKDYLKGESNKAFNEIVLHFTPLVYSACIRKQLDEETAKDITQQVFLDFHKKAKSLVNHPNLSGWFYQAAIFRALNQINKNIRDQKRMEKLKDLGDQKALEKENWSRVIFPQLDDALKEIPENLSKAIVQHYLVGNSIVESSENLEISEVAMRKRLSRGVQALKEYFSNRGMKVTGAVLIAILSSHELRAVPKSLVSSIIENTSKQFQSSSSLIQGTLIMSSGTKISILTITLILIGSLVGVIFLNEPDSPESTGQTVKSLNNDGIENEQVLHIGNKARRLQVKLKERNKIIENNLTGDELVFYIVQCFKNRPTHKEWYDIIQSCGIKIPEHIFFEEIAPAFPEPMNGTEHLDDFFEKIIQNFAKSNPKLAIEWAINRQFLKAMNWFSQGWDEDDSEEIRKFLHTLPDSKGKERALKELSRVRKFNDYTGYFQSLPQDQGREKKLASLAYKMSEKYPLKSYEWIKSNLQGVDAHTAMKSIVFNLAKKDPEKALELFSNLESDEDRKSYIDSIIRGSITNNIEFTESFIDKLDSNKEEAFKLAASTYIRINPFEGMKLFEKYGINPTDSDVSSFIKRGAVKDFDKTYDYVVQKLPLEKHFDHLVELARKSGKYFPEKNAFLIEDLISVKSLKISNPYNDPNQTSEEFRNKEKSAGFKEQNNLYNAVYTVTNELFFRDPKFGYEWLNGIPFQDSKTYDSVFKNVLWMWDFTNNQSPIEWAESSELSPELKKKFIASVEKLEKQ